MVINYEKMDARKGHLWEEPAQHRHIQNLEQWGVPGVGWLMPSLDSAKRAVAFPMFVPNGGERTVVALGQFMLICVNTRGV